MAKLRSGTQKQKVQKNTKMTIFQNFTFNPKNKHTHFQFGVK